LKTLNISYLPLIYLSRCETNHYNWISNNLSLSLSHHYTFKHTNNNHLYISKDLSIVSHHVCNVQFWFRNESKFISWVSAAHCCFLVFMAGKYRQNSMLTTLKYYMIGSQVQVVIYCCLLVVMYFLFFFSIVFSLKVKSIYNTI